MILISACLLGLACRYDGNALPDDVLWPASGPGFSRDTKDASSHTEPDAMSHTKREAGEAILIPVCPEQLGGLPTPRPAAQIVGGSGEDVLEGRARVIAENGADLTAAFLRGARETLHLCRSLGVQEAILKQGSPSCGCGRIHRGRERVPGMGVTAALLQGEGIRVRAFPE